MEKTKELDIDDITEEHVKYNINTSQQKWYHSKYIEFKKAIDPKKLEKYKYKREIADLYKFI